MLSIWKWSPYHSGWTSERAPPPERSAPTLQCRKLLVIAFRHHNHMSPLSRPSRQVTTRSNLVNSSGRLAQEPVASASRDPRVLLVLLEATGTRPQRITRIPGRGSLARFSHYLSPDGGRAGEGPPFSGSVDSSVSAQRCRGVATRVYRVRIEPSDSAMSPVRVR